VTRTVRLGDVANVTQGIGTSGRAAGATTGDWEVTVVSVGDIQDDRLSSERSTKLALARNVKTEKHLLRPDDVLVTARSTVLKAALVPPTLSRAVADATLLVVRPTEPDLGSYLWWFFTSTFGRSELQARMYGSTVLTLTASTLADVEMPLPSQAELFRIADLVDASERAYTAAIEAARLRRALARDAVVDRLRHQGE
jgi:hypothetical protein